MITERLRETLKRDEGLNLKRHEVQGIDHIGYGINLENELPQELLDYLGVEDEDEIDEITQEQADYLLDHFVGIAVRECGEYYASLWDELSPLRQEILVNLHFNLGLLRLKAFRKMNKAVVMEDWVEASAQMLDSKAARQTGERYPRLASAFATNDEKNLKLDKLYDVGGQRAEQIDSPLSGLTDQEVLSQIKVLNAEVERRLGIYNKGEN